jgi:hypothetical protein
MYWAGDTVSSGDSPPALVFEQKNTKWSIIATSNIVRLTTTTFWLQLLAKTKKNKNALFQYNLFK